MTPPDDRSWQPSTFQERGVAVPFTSPMLAGARARLTERRCDVVVPHPGGARGVYIFALGSLTEFCTPSLHDQRLVERVAALRPLSPHGVRLAARAVAAEGWAGRAAAAAAQAADLRDEQMAQHFETVALQSILLQGSQAATGSDPKQRTAQALLALARRTGRDADAVKADVERLARLLVAAGLDAGLRPQAECGPPGRCQALLDSIAQMRSGMLAWAANAGDQPACAQVAGSASLILSTGRSALATAQRVLDDPATLLTAWAKAPDIVAARLCRPDWLLDGWEHLCLLWSLAETEVQKAEAAVEACLLLPPIPPEIGAWFGAAPDLLAQLQVRPAAIAGRNQPPSQAVCVTARNERIRAMAA